ncbi:MAG TPA: hypothetical protein VFV38_43955 [Ktedonobacteraceae bacterium]|nr:hypothetical protein [Ktedonobacteraceae bacterium]
MQEKIWEIKKFLEKPLDNLQEMWHTTDTEALERIQRLCWTCSWCSTGKATLLSGV